jgi:hypothetical protein
VQLLTVGQDTARKVLLRSSGFGVVSIVQVLLFQASATGVTGKESLNRPTAVHALARLQETPNKNPTDELVGVVWIFQALPFHRSTSGAESVVTPTAVHALLAVQDTP